MGGYNDAMAMGFLDANSPNRKNTSHAWRWVGPGPNGQPQIKTPALEFAPAVTPLVPESMPKSANLPIAGPVVPESANLPIAGPVVPESVNLSTVTSASPAKNTTEPIASKGYSTPQATIFPTMTGAQGTEPQPPVTPIPKINQLTQPNQVSSFKLPDTSNLRFGGS